MPLPADAKAAALTDMRAGFKNTAMYNPVTHMERFVFAPLTVGAGAPPLKKGAAKGGTPACFLAVHSSVPLNTISVWWDEVPTDQCGVGSERMVAGGVYAAGAGMYDLEGIRTAKAALAAAREGSDTAKIATAEADLATVLWKWRRCQMGVEIAIQVRWLPPQIVYLGHSLHSHSTHCTRSPCCRRWAVGRTVSWIR